jgi:hypothetical protein
MKLPFSLVKLLLVKFILQFFLGGKNSDIWLMYSGESR